MPHILGERGKTVYPGDVRHGTRWATPEEKELAARALYELETERNVIGFAPAPQQNFVGHKIRVQEQKNPAWYRRFGEAFWKSKRVFVLKRKRVEKALCRVLVVGIVRSNGLEVQLLKLLGELNAVHKDEAVTR